MAYVPDGVEGDDDDERNATLFPGLGKALGTRGDRRF